VVKLCRPAGLVLVTRWVAASYAVRQSWPLMTVESVSVTTVNGLAESDRMVERRLVMTDESPEGSRTSNRPGNATAVPQRGSPARRTTVSVPSGSHELPPELATASAARFRGECGSHPT
jgi:hypothetical protein